VFEKKPVLITGANGLLGRFLCKALKARGLEVIAVNRPSDTGEIDGVTYCPLDLGGHWDTDRLPKKLTAIIHLAQSPKFRDFPDSAMDVFKVNVESTARLLDYAKRVGVKQFVYASSGGVYGKGARAFDENSPIVAPGQLGYYLGSKLCGEVLAHSYASLFQVTVLRFFFMYGPGQNRSMLIPRLMDRVAAGDPITLQGPQGIRINPVHVKDAAEAVVAALKTEQSATFNISGPDVISIREICEAMGRYLNREPKFQYEPGEPRDLIGDNSLMRKLLAPPRMSLIDHLKDVQINTMY
jgi:UDP-glucose 4-epimerase